MPVRKYFSGNRIVLKNKKTGELMTIIVEFEHPNGVIQTKDMKFIDFSRGDYEPLEKPSAPSRA